ncbi:MAG: hypothetical protein R2939_17460 [Kofleriaceae bacterium]
MWLDATIVALALGTALVLLSRRIRDDRAWRATVTPLASIIGSGFLVVVPLLGHTVGRYAPLAMAGVVVFAYAIGAALRFNIAHAEPLLASDDAPPTLRRLEQVGSVALALAYFVSVAFYLRLLAAFAFEGAGHPSVVAERITTTVILAAIGAVGWWRGLDALERLEEYSVSIKLAIIAALLVGWGLHDATGPILDGADTPAEVASAWQTFRVLAGVLIVVQGFETSRYLGDTYDGATRVRTMRWAQLASGAIYVAFVALTVPSLAALPDAVDETAIITLSRRVATVLPPMLVVAALMSQLSAAVADTVGAGGLLRQAIGRRLGAPAKAGYPLVAAIGIALVWAVDIFEIVAVASRLFAGYYAVQCVVAALVAARGTGGAGRWARVAALAALAAVLALAAAVAVPAG